MARRRKLFAHGVLDFRPGIDRVVRRGKKAFVVDSQGLYEDREVDGDVMDAQFIEHAKTLTREQAGVLFTVIQSTPFLSPEGRSERLEALIQSKTVKLTFTVKP